MNVVVFDIGALRADHLGCYGSRRPTSPTIDTLAVEGTRFDAAFSSDATNAGARAALFSGRFGFETGIVTDGCEHDTVRGHTPVSVYGQAAPRPMLAEYLAAHGVQTAAISPFGRQPARWFYHGWREVIDPWCLREPREVTAADVNALALPWLADRARAPFFLYLSYNNLYQAADTPLTAAELKHIETFAAHNDALTADDDAFARHLSLHAAFSARFHRMATRAAARRLADEYDARLRVVDDAVRDVVVTLRAADLLESTLLAIVSDHGVLFGECGCYGGHISAHYRCVRVPLIVRAPALLPTGASCTAPCYTLDLASTVCQAFGVATPAGFVGRPLTRSAGAPPESRRGFVVCGHGQYTAQRTLLSGEWKLNRTWHAGFWDFPDTALYNIADDAREEHDRAGEEPGRVLELLRKLRQWTEEYGAAHADPLARVACDEPPGFLQYGHALRARVRRGEVTPPEGYAGRWV